MDDVRRLPVGENDEIALSLDELAREGARRMIAAALEAEVETRSLFRGATTIGQAVHHIIENFRGYDGFGPQPLILQLLLPYRPQRQELGLQGTSITRVLQLQRIDRLADEVDPCRQLRIDRLAWTTAEEAAQLLRVEGP